MDREKIFNYWIDSSDNDFKAMSHLFEKGDYSWALFVGHLVIEKLLKAFYVQHINEAPPFIHDLVRLSENAGLALNESQKDILDTISAFNLRARYDDYKMDFHRKCDREFTAKWIHEIEAFRKWIKSRLLNP